MRMISSGTGAGLLLLLLIGIALNTTGCMRYLTHERSDVLLDAVDIDQTLQIAEAYLENKEGGWGSSLGIWVIRDQHMEAHQAEKVSALYFSYINGLKRSFDVWHLTWAVANMYKLGDDDVKAALSAAYADASSRAKVLGGSADRMVNGDRLYMGDAHSGGRAFAHRHVVVPGNKRYVQSYQDYLNKNK